MVPAGERGTNGSGRIANANDSGEEGVRKREAAAFPEEEAMGRGDDKVGGGADGLGRNDKETSGGGFGDDDTPRLV